MIRSTFRAALALMLALASWACGGEPPAADQNAAAVSDTAVEGEPRGELIEVGEQAPDFALRGATRYGVLAEPVRLSDYRGKTVVLAFFFRARGRG